MASSSAPVTALLQAWVQGSPEAKDRLFQVIYADLRRRAAKQLKGERKEHTLSPTGLVHEAYLRLAGGANMEWQNRAQFLAVASQIMRHVLIDHARARLAGKRPEGRVRVTLEDVATPSDASDYDLLALNDALDELEGLDPRPTQIVVLRYFGGLSIDETAHVLDISATTVKREWRVAKAWLHRRLTQRAKQGSPLGS